MKLSEWAKQQGICYLTALKWFHKGMIPNSKQLSTGTIIVENNVSFSNKTFKNYIYARVSNQSRKAEMQYQIDRIINFANNKGLCVDKVFKEIASGMNDNRKELWKMINNEPSKIIIEHKDRLTRFGFDYLEKLLNKLGCEIIVMNKDHEDEKDLIKDMISIVTSFCCRLYGLRRGKNKAKVINKELVDEKN